VASTDDPYLSVSWFTEAPHARMMALGTPNF